MKYLITKIFSALFMLMLLSSMAYAQFTATGTVSDENGTLPYVTVSAKNTTIGVTTDLDGNFTIKLPGESATLVVAYVGYRTSEVEVSAANPRVAVVLESGAEQLEEVIITGLATTVKRSNSANSVASLDAKDITGITSQSTLDGALYGKFTGAEIRSNSGAPGGGMSIKLRGVTSIFGDQQPLYIVDGVYVDNSSVTLGTNVVSAAASGGNTSTNQDDASNRIADIDPEDIEKIEILKGASAAAIYGSRAAGGVVLITTKKGKSGKTKVSFSQAIGATSILNPLGLREWTAQRVEDTYGAAEVPVYEQAVADGKFYDYEDEIYGNKGILSTSRLNVSGGNEKTQFFVGGTFKHEDGIVKNTGYEKASLRANIDHKLTDWLDFSLTNSYVNSTSDRGFFNNSNTNTTVGYALAFTKPWDELHADANGIYPDIGVGSNALQTIDIITNKENVNRYIGGLSTTFKLFSNENNNLKLVARAGLDQYALRSTAIFPQELVYFQDPTSLQGVLVSGSTVNTNTNLSAFLVHNWYAKGSSGMALTTQVGVTQENFDKNTVISTGNGINGSQTGLGQTTNRDVFQTRLKQQDKGAFIQEEVNWDDKIIFTAGLRADKSSNNGDVNKLFFYPKANIALNLNKFAFWTVDAMNQFKLRAAFGQSGRFANFGDKFTSLGGVTIQGQGGWDAFSLQGNSDVSPERQSEYEFGTDLGFLKNRLSIEATYYIKTIDNLLLRVNVPGSTGFSQQVKNAGSLRNNGIELGLNALPVKTESFEWTSGINFWKNKSKITRLDVPSFNLGGFGSGLGTYQIQEGASATQIGGAYIADDCGTPDCSDVDPDGDGFAVYGNAEADFNMSFNNNLNFKGVELSFLVHWKQGGDGINLSTLLTDFGGISPDYDDTDLDPTGQLANGPYRLSQFPNNPRPFIEDAGYVRLREVGLYYTIPKKKLGDIAGIKVGFSGQNLLNFFSYQSYDPEVSNFGGNLLANNVEVTPFPSAKRFTFHFNVNF